MGEFKWVPRPRNYKTEIPELELSETLVHPLRSLTSHVQPEPSRGRAESSASGGSTASSLVKGKKKKAEPEQPEFIDPLGATMKDPLWNGQGEDADEMDWKRSKSMSPPGVDTGGKISNTLRDTSPVKQLVREVGEGTVAGLKPWSERRAGILSRYTTDERLSIISSYLPGGLPAQAKLTGLPQSRLDDVDEEGSGQDKLRRIADLSQVEYVNRTNQLNAALIKAWSEDRRVDSVKIVIQCAKLLAEVPVPSFYPRSRHPLSTRRRVVDVFSQFVLVTDIVDTFGRLVQERLRLKADEELTAAGKAPLGSGVSWADRVPETTQETARNWFYKVASIRELLPRLYVEATLLRILPFLGPNALAFGNTGSHLHRLASMTRGIAQPLVAAYARCFLARVGLNLGTHPLAKDHLWLSVHDLLRLWPNDHVQLQAMERTPNGAIGGLPSVSLPPGNIEVAFISIGDHSGLL